MKKLVQLGEQYVSCEKFGKVKKYNTISELGLPDVADAQQLLEDNSHELFFDVESAYSERNERLKKFLGTYEVTPNLYNEYQNFINEMYKIGDRLSFKYLSDCGNVPNFEEWKSGKKIVNGRIMKVGKLLKNYGFSDSLISFYASQSKNGEKVFLTISDTAYDILGMTYHNNGSWTSCQNLDRELQYNQSLEGSLNDEKLVVCFLHESLNEVLDFEGTVIARTVMRLFDFDGIDILVPTSLYGESHAQKMLNNALMELGQFNIFSRDISKNTDVTLWESHDLYTTEVASYGYAYEEISREIEIDCPLCDGERTIEKYDQYENDVIFDCPMCDGSGEYTVFIEETIEEELETTTEREVYPYAENYSFSAYGEYSEIKVNSDYVRNVLDGKELIFDDRSNDLQNDKYDDILKYTLEFDCFNSEKEKIVKKINDEFFKNEEKSIFTGVIAEVAIQLESCGFAYDGLKELLWFEEWDKKHIREVTSKFFSVVSNVENSDEISYVIRENTEWNYAKIIDTAKKFKKYYNFLNLMKADKEEIKMFTNHLEKKGEIIKMIFA